MKRLNGIIFCTIIISSLLVKSLVYPNNYEEALIQDLSKYMVNRAQKEIFDSYISRLRFNKLFKHFFPESYGFLYNNDLSSISSNLLWHSYLREDFSNFIDRLHLFFKQRYNNKYDKFINIIFTLNDIINKQKFTKIEEIDNFLDIDKIKELLIIRLKKPEIDSMVSYNKSIKYLLQIFKEIKKNNIEKQNNKNNDKEFSIKYTKIIHNLFLIFDDLDEDIPEYHRKLLWSIASIADSDKQNVVKTVIYEFTMPVGSYKVKRESRYFIFVNSYLGVSYYQKRLYNDDFNAFDLDSDPLLKKDNKDKKYHPSIFAPIGIEFGLSFFDIGVERKARGCLEGLSFSYLFSIIDLAKPIQSYIKKKEDEKYTFKDVISPGIYYVIGFSNLPLSFGLGYNYYLYREKNILTNKTEFINEHRFQFFVSIDMPLFPVFVR